MHSADREGAEVYEMRVRNLETGEDLDRIENTYYGSAWSRDAIGLFYTRPDAMMRPLPSVAPRCRNSGSTKTLSFSKKATSASSLASATQKPTTT